MKKIVYRISGAQFIKAVISFKRQKKRAGKTAVQIGEGDQHICPARPDVECVFFHLKSAAFPGWDCEFLVAMRQVHLRKIKSPYFLHVHPDC